LSLKRMKYLSTLREISNANDGFTLIELLISFFLSVLLFILIIPGCTGKNIKAFHFETISNLKVIQVALERYAVDHDGEYPQFIMGGDKGGWMGGCESIRNRPSFVENIRQTNFKGGGAKPPLDPLIEGGYLDPSYPQNPFCRDPGDSSKIIELTGGDPLVSGSGDVRFGHDGAVMGNVIDDPRFLWDVYPVFDQPDKTRLQPTRLVNTFSPEAYERNIGSIHPRNIINPFYSMGGIPKEGSKKGTVAYWWPGEFLYRASGDMILKKDVNPEKLMDEGRLNIWDFEVVKFDRYILAAYGDKKNAGIDLVRITTLEHKPINNHSGIITETYGRSSYAPYDENVAVFMSPPEVFGGGDYNNNPIFPFFDNVDGEKRFMYGAPDGFPDGILNPVFIDHESEF